LPFAISTLCIVRVDCDSSYYNSWISYNVALCKRCVSFSKFSRLAWLFLDFVGIEGVMRYLVKQQFSFLESGLKIVDKAIFRGKFVKADKIVSKQVYRQKPHVGPLILNQNLFSSDPEMLLIVLIKVHKSSVTRENISSGFGLSTG